MVEVLNTLLPIILYVAGIVALIILAILGVKLINTIDKVNRIADDVEEKISSLNPTFEFVSRASDTLAAIGDSVVGAIAGIVSKVFRRKSRKDEEDYYE